MSTIAAVYENGVFRPLEPVDLPEQTRVEVRVELKPMSGPSDPNPASDDGMDAIYEVLSHRHRSGRSDLAARHGELNP